MRPDRKLIKKRAAAIQGTVGFICLAMMAFVLVWAGVNLVKGFKDPEEVRKADTVSAAESKADTSGTGSEPADSTASAESGAPADSAAQQQVTTAAPAETQPAAATKVAYTGWKTDDTDEVTVPDSSSAEEQLLQPSDIADDFSDAVFVGNSLTVGLSMNCGKPLATFYASTGLNVNTIWDSATITLDSGGYGTVFDALAQKQFGRVYVMFGINEIGWPYWDVFQTNYIEVVNKIKELQPNAKIYIESVLPVSSKAIETNEVFTTANVDAINEYIKKVASDTGSVYLNVNSALRLEDGSLPEDASTDGIHLLKQYCLVWLKYLADNS